MYVQHLSVNITKPPFATTGLARSLLLANNQNVQWNLFFAVNDATLGGRFNRTEEPKYWLDDVMCQGDEEYLLNCTHREPIGTHNCGSGERAGVHCLSKYIILNVFIDLFGVTHAGTL